MRLIKYMTFGVLLVLGSWVIYASSLGFINLIYYMYGYPKPSITSFNMCYFFAIGTGLAGYCMYRAISAELL